VAPDRKPTRVRSVQDVLDWARPSLVELDHEELWLLCLNAKNALRCAERVAQGGLHGCSVTPRDVLRPAVRNAAAAVVVVHNHPSGDPTPSPEDYAMTQALAHACDVVGIPLLDHVVVARAGACSVGVPPPGV
jgi:DNA repair protein RadC